MSDVEREGRGARRHQLGQEGLDAERLRGARGRRGDQRRGQAARRPDPGLREDVAEDLPGAPAAASRCRPTDLIATWKQRFPEFWPEGNSFYAPLTGIEPGEVALIGMTLPGKMKLSTGVMVLYADEESFTLMTPQGHMFAGWITFSATERERRDRGPGAGADARVGPDLRDRADARRPQAGGPLLGRRRSRRSARTSARPMAHVDTQVVCVDKKRQWSKWRNVWHSSAIRSTLYMLGAPRARREGPVPLQAAGCLTRSSSAPGPNGLAAAIALARAGRSVLVLEAAETVGGGSRSAELTLPGFVHDVCSAVHPHPLASPFLRDAAAGRARARAGPARARRWRTRSTTARAVVLDRSVDATAASIGGADGDAYRELLEPLRARRREAAARDPRPAAPDAPPDRAGALRPARPALGASGLARRFDGPRARALLRRATPRTRCCRSTGPPTSAVALVLMLTGHHVGWPVARGGSQAIADALASILRSLGGEIVTGAPRRAHRRARRRRRGAARPHAAPGARDRRRPAARRATGARSSATATAPASSSSTGRSTARSRGRRRSARARARSTSAARSRRSPPPRRRRRTGRARRAAVRPGRPADGLRPQPRAGGQAHGLGLLPRAARLDARHDRARSRRQIERFAPGFRDRILARPSMHAGGDGGLQPQLRRRRHQRRRGWTCGQLFTRPVARPSPYTTPDPRLFICSSSTPPGGGVHGMCGYWAAQAALRRGERGDLAEVAAGDVGLLAERARHHPRPRHEGRLRARGERAGAVPGVGGDQAHLADRDAERVGHELVGLAARA